MCLHMEHHTHLQKMYKEGNVRRRCHSNIDRSLHENFRYLIGKIPNNDFSPCDFKKASCQCLSPSCWRHHRQSSWAGRRSVVIAQKPSKVAEVITTRGLLDNRKEHGCSILNEDGEETVLAWEDGTLLLGKNHHITLMILETTCIQHLYDIEREVQVAADAQNWFIKEMRVFGFMMEEVVISQSLPCCTHVQKRSSHSPFSQKT